jgi:hypothetical protein
MRLRYLGLASLFLCGAAHASVDSDLNSFFKGM